MVKCFQLFRGSKPMDNKCYSNRSVALKEMKEANKQFREYNQFIKQRKLDGKSVLESDRKPIKLVRVKEVSFSKKSNVFA